MLEVIEIFNGLENLIPLFRTIAALVILIIVFNFILSVAKKNLLQRAKTKKQISNVQIFSKIFRYVFFLIIILFAIFTYSGSWTSLGLMVGLLSAALGWALQKPITGIAAWIMVVTRRPFEIGDRIIIGAVRGDVLDVTLTHVYLKEIGGTVPGEENSGRTIMVPNSILFEQNIINYTLQDEYILSEVIVAVTYESNLDKAIKIAKEAATKITKDFIEHVKRKPYIQTSFQPSGIDVHVKYFVPATRVQEISSSITKEIYDRIMKAKRVEIAYPHTEVLFRKK